MSKKFQGSIAILIILVICCWPAAIIYFFMKYEGLLIDGQPDRHCPNCGRNIPFDANICPYCSKKFSVVATPKAEKIKSDDASLQILKSRYANGEITKKEFEQMKKDLE